MCCTFCERSPLKISFLMVASVGLYDRCLLELELPADFSIKSFAYKERIGCCAIRQLLANVGVV